MPSTELYPFVRLPAPWEYTVLPNLQRHGAQLGSANRAGALCPEASILLGQIRPLVATATWSLLRPKQT